MKSIFLLIFIVFTYSTNISAAENESGAEPDTAQIKTWTPTGVLGIKTSQIALENWSQGGENALSYSIFGNFGLLFTDQPWELVNSLKLSYGRTKLGGDDFKTNDNEIYLESVLTRDVGWKVKPFFSNILRTGITSGYDYSGDSPMKITQFFDPGYLTQSLGLQYDELEGFSTRLGVAVQEVFTNNFRKYSDDPDTPDELEKFKLETGIESVTKAEYAIQSNLLYQGDLRLFTRFNDLATWDVRFDNTLTAKISEYFNVSLNVLLVYDKIQSHKTQVKEALQLGFTYAIFN